MTGLACHGHMRGHVDMYGNHPYGTRHKRDIKRRKSMAPAWRTTDHGTMPQGTPRAAFYRSAVA